MKILYLTWGETPRSYGVFGSQVVRQLSSLGELFPTLNLELVSGLPLIHSGLIREKFSYMKELSKLKMDLGNIPFEVITILCSQSFVNSSECTFPFLHGLSQSLLLQKIIEMRPDIVHCRSYHATWAALNVRERIGGKFSIVFDARGLWPEEVAFKKKWDIRDRNYLFLKGVEEFIVKNADITVSVSDYMTASLTSIGPRDIKTIYLSADPGQSPKSAPRASALDESNRKTTLCYVGALTDSSWHSIHSLIELYAHYRKCVINPSLLIVTTSDHNTIHDRIVSHADITSEEVSIVASKTTEELYKMVSSASFGALPYRIVTGDSMYMEEVVGASILGTKTAEYLSAGLPVLVNAFCKSAAEVVRNGEVGIVFSPESYKEINNNTLDELLNEEVSARARAMAGTNFSYETNAQKYMTLYESLMN